MSGKLHDIEEFLELFKCKLVPIFLLFFFLYLFLCLKCLVFGLV